MPATPLRRSILSYAAAALASLGLQALASTGAMAQTYPSRPVKLIVPYPAGGSTDQLARLIAVPMAKSLGQPVVVENISGGNTMIGTAAAARAAADGHTVLVNSLAFSVNVLVTRQPSYRTEDFIPVAPLVTNPYVLSVNLNVPANSVKELVDYARREPAKVNAVSLGLGGVTHLLNERFAAAAGVPITSIHYRGAGPALVDLMSGQVQFFIDTAVTSMPHLRANKLRPLAVSTPERSALLPTVPTFKELGFPAMTQEGWFGVFVPKGTPAPIVERLNREVLQAMATPEVQQIVLRDGLRVPQWTPQQFADFIKEDSAAWAGTVKNLNIQLD
ncbi:MULTISPECIES: Bug family tripartite tricarboxylate transporter substrate binding protein [Ramlibacter]|uniref:Tripartite tricarboxylate transporter substrate binding protein n=1 Tax=Ramlibacter pinisoli TaxID=2682844 RepID=A0A6N8J1F2_9BURK|nr:MULTISPECIES: tripartite tricarboxylate transporter substrate binding protein [Ramlibacter]MBA2962171.1 tripartite tricarboxylate transporter substrate binding protein [Ramlibacter sp. CGMCC 1.13660]MVQ32113.1 tripartite tricarboxylate transporter substrate binding protein [Ramlibacter pinisoli]